MDFCGVSSRLSVSVFNLYRPPRKHASHSRCFDAAAKSSYGLNDNDLGVLDLCVTRTTSAAPPPTGCCEPRF